MNCLRFSLIFVLCAGVVSVVPFQSAQAGFDWVAPAPSVPDPISDAMATSRVEEVAPVERVEIPVNDVSPVISIPPDVSAPVDIAPVPANEPASIARPSVSSSKRAVYPPVDNLAALPLKGNRAAPTDYVAPSHRTVSESVTVHQQPVAVSQPTVGTVTEQPVKMSVIEPVVSPTDRDPVDLAILSGFGNSIPLSLAIEQIVPSSFTVKYNDQPDPDTVVSWAGERPWNKVLEDMLYAHGYRVMVGQKTVTIFRAGNAPSVTTQNLSTPVAALQKMTSAAPVEGVVVPAPSMADLTSPSIPSGYQAQRVDIFSARAGERARDVLSRWSDQAVVQLYWEAGDNFILNEPVAYNATFARAVEQVLGQFRGLPARPVAELHPNAPAGPVVLNIRAAGEDTLVVR